MPDQRLPLLRGRITVIESYESPQGGFGSPPRIPSLDPRTHSANLMGQLDALAKQVQARQAGARDELATREIVAVRPANAADLSPEQLDSSKADARLIGLVPETGTVLLDVASAQLDYLRERVVGFSDDARVTTKVRDDGSTSVTRESERAIAPIGTIGLAELGDVVGAELRSGQLVADRAYWFEIACRGGYRRPPDVTAASRSQLAQQLHRVGALQNIDEFLGPEQTYFFLRLTLRQLEALRSATDCIYEVELAPPPIRDLKLLDDTTTSDVSKFVLQPPPADAPAIVILDTGISTGHPLLKAAILAATKAAPEMPSAEDTHGHGTKMAGVALHRDLGAAIQHGRADAPHWLLSSRLLVAPHTGAASDDNCDKWPVVTLGSVRAAEEADPTERNRAFVLAVTRTMQDPPLSQLAPTLWSHAVDQLAFGGGYGRLMIVSAGNAREGQWLPLAQQHPQLQLSEKIHQPAQATSCLTVGAFTQRVTLPATSAYATYRSVATRPGGISPFTSAGLPGVEWPIKPDVVMEGGNLAVSGNLTDPTVPTLNALTASHRHVHGQPLGQLNMTSEAAARAGHLAARIWSVEPKLRPASVRALIVHSASWTPAMREQFIGLNDRLLACGYGVPDESQASECAQNLATVTVEDVMPNAVLEEEPKKKPPKRAGTKTTEPKVRRKVKLYRLPVPDTLMAGGDTDVELRVTLSYFPEPNKFGRSIFHGLDLKWDMQGPQELEGEFLQRVNVLKRPKLANGKRTKIDAKKSFDWDLGIQVRSRGTVQSDRWRGKLSSLVGDKLIAIVPVLGWWDQRRELRLQEMPFSLVVSVFGTGVYAAIKPRIEAEAQVPIQV